MEEKYDTALLGILQHEGKIEKFLNVVLGFLYRRTDFYRHMKSKDDKLGFPPGVALKMLTSIFQRYDTMTRQDDMIREAKREEMERKKKQTETKQTSNKPASTDTQQAENSSDGSQKSSAPVDTSSSDQQSKSQSSDVSGDIPVMGDMNKGDISESLTEYMYNKVKTEKSEVSGTETAVETENDVSKTKARSEEDEDPELTRQQKVFQENSESYNGAVRGNYSWSQSITDVDLRVKVPSYIKKGKDVKVDIDKKHVKVEHKDELGQWKVVVDGELCWEIHKDDSMWTLNPGQNVHINFEKKQERWWEAVFTDEPKINVRKIDASRPMTDLDDEAQAKIEELMYNDRRKKMGLPTTQEEKMQDMLKKAWDAEGSPFKGQEFDPSRFSMDPSGVINMKPS